jgi:cytochrome c oxidase cbb3-type subunit III
MKRECRRRAVGAIRFMALSAVFCAGGAITAYPVFANGAATAKTQEGARKRGGDSTGRELFVANCSRCHALDGSGGEGPNIQDAPVKLGDEGLARTIKNGVAGTGMPAFTGLSDAEVAAILSYIRSLTKIAPSAVPLSGDSERGKAVYAQEKCDGCHMIDGQGGSFGPELSFIGGMRSPDVLRAAITSPGENLPKTKPNRDRGKWTQYLMFRATTKDGRAFEGMRVAGDSFTIILQDAQGNFHSFAKADLTSLAKEPGKSFMPGFSSLSMSQLDDLIAYLATLKGAQ